jgi:hypothetical protein
MSEPLTLDLLDRDGAISEALDEGTQGTRAQFFRRAIAGWPAAALAAATLLVGVAVGLGAAGDRVYQVWLKPRRGAPQPTRSLFLPRGGSAAPTSPPVLSARIA